MSLSRHLPNIVVCILGAFALLSGVRSILKWPSFAASTFRRWCVAGSAVALFGVMFGSVAVRAASVSRHVPDALARLLGIAGPSLTVIAVVAWLTATIMRFVPRPTPAHSRARRSFLLAARGVVMAAPIAAAGYGVFIQRGAIRLSEVDLPVAGLPWELDGLRVVQLSDIHLSPFLSESELARAIDMANETRPHLALVTGDLITASEDPLDVCLRQLARLKAEGGVLGCLGNHEIYTKTEDYVTRQGVSFGIDFLRSRSRILQFRGRSLNFAGVDYQRMGRIYLAGAEKMIQPGMPNILLSHNPDVIPVAAQKGFDCTIAGHTHGGQINFEILHQNLNVARFYTPFTYGLYREGNHHGYVTRGIGTVGLPARLGAPPEVALIRLCAT